MGFWEHLIAGAAVKAFSDASKETKKHNDLCWQLSDLETEFDSYLKRVGCDCVYIADWGCIDTGSVYPEKQKIESLKRKIDTYIKIGGNPKYIDDLDEIDECIEKVKYLRDKGMLHRQDEFRNENDLYWIKDTIENEEKNNMKLAPLLNCSSNELTTSIPNNHHLYVPYDDSSCDAICTDNARIYNEDIANFFDFKIVAVRFTQKNIFIYEAFDFSKMHYKRTFTEYENVNIVATSIPAVPSWGLVDINGLELLMPMEEAEGLKVFYTNHNESSGGSTEPTIHVDEAVDVSPDFEILTINDARIWNPDEESFVDHEVKIEFSTKKIVLYLVSLNRELFSVNIDEGSFVATEILESDMPNKAILKLANSTHILMDIENANKVNDYYNVYNEYIEEQEDKKQQRIVEISNEIFNLDKMALIALENVDEHILLNHDTMICLQLMFAHKKYRSIKLADEDSVNHANTLIGIAVIKEMIDTIHESVEDNYPEYTEDEIKYATWEAIKRVSIKYYSDKWEELYGKYIDTPLKQSTSSEADGTLDRYIEKILLNTHIDNDEVWVMCYFTYYMMDKGYIDGDLYYPAFFEIVVSAFSTFKRNMNLV